MITCAHCGAALSAAALRFCTVCGGEVGPLNTETTTPASTPADTTTTPASTPADTANRRVLLAVLTVLGVATVAVTILLLRESGSGSDTTTAATTTTEAAITPATRTPLPPTPVFVPRTAAASVSTGPSPSASFPPTRPPTGTTALATTSTPLSDPATVVARYYDAINRGDYATAWTLGGSNLGSTYTTFVAGFSDTVSDRLTIGSVSGDTVQVRVAAQRTDGSVRLYAGSYTIRNGTITKGTLRATGTTPP